MCKTQATLGGLHFLPWLCYPKRGLVFAKWAEELDL